MATHAITGNDTIIINGFNCIDLADGDIGTLTYPNDIMTVKTGKNGNSIMSKNEAGRQGESTLRVIRGSTTDKFLHGLYTYQNVEPAAFVALQGQFIKRIGNGLGKVSADTYMLLFGAFSKGVEVTSNTDGNTDQGVSVYSFRWANVVRAVI